MSRRVRMKQFVLFVLVKLDERFLIKRLVEDADDGSIPHGILYCRFHEVALHWIYPDVFMS